MSVAKIAHVKLSTSPMSHDMLTQTVEVGVQKPGRQDEDGSATEEDSDVRSARGGLRRRINDYGSR
jgi:hypothetical protein